MEKIVKKAKRLGIFGLKERTKIHKVGGISFLNYQEEANNRSGRIGSLRNLSTLIAFII